MEQKAPILPDFQQFGTWSLAVGQSERHLHLARAFLFVLEQPLTWEADRQTEREREIIGKELN